jgi:hypothetical protein
MKQFFAKLFGSSARKSRPAARQMRPQLEGLECRDNPSHGVGAISQVAQQVAHLQQQMQAVMQLQHQVTQMVAQMHQPSLSFTSLLRA